MDIKVLGTGCVNCRTTVSLIEEVAKEKGATITLTKVEDLRQIASYCIDPVNSCSGVNVEGNDDEHPDGRRHQALDSQA